MMSSQLAIPVQRRTYIVDYSNDISSLKLCSTSTNVVRWSNRIIQVHQQTWPLKWHVCVFYSNIVCITKCHPAETE